MLIITTRNVAVPVNYGMLSYFKVTPESLIKLSQSPSIMECSPTGLESIIRRSGGSQSPSIMECSPTLDNNCDGTVDKSQSPSIMECSPTKNQKLQYALDCVAVPVNYGMLSYTNEDVFTGTLDGRSPRQLWNALLPIVLDTKQKVRKSQSPSIMECSPTKEILALNLPLNVAVPVNYGMLSYTIMTTAQIKDLVSQSPSIMECSPTKGLWGVAEVLLVAVPVNYGMLSYC